jgi:hypothetical protein
MVGAVTKPHAGRRLLAALGLAPEPPPGPVPAALTRARSRPRVPGPRRAEPIRGVAVGGGQAERDYVLAWFTP